MEILQFINTAVRSDLVRTSEWFGYINGTTIFSRSLGGVRVRRRRLKFKLSKCLSIEKLRRFLYKIIYLNFCPDCEIRILEITRICLVIIEIFKVSNFRLDNQNYVAETDDGLQLCHITGTNTDACANRRRRSEII